MMNEHLMGQRKFINALLGNDIAYTLLQSQKFFSQ